MIFSDLALARRLERAEGHASAAFVDARALTFPDRGAAWIEVGGALAMFDGVDSPLTQTFALGLSGPVPAADFEALEQFFRDRASPIHHEVSPLADASVLALIQERQYQVIEFTSVMWRPIARDLRLSAPINPAVVARPIRAEEHDVWARTLAAGWSHLPELSGFMHEHAVVSAHTSSQVAFIAEIDAAPIAAGGVSMRDGVALLAGASTVPGARRQGAQLAMLEARLRHAAAHDCDIAMMGAHPGSDSQRNAERQGFRIAYTRIKWRARTGPPPRG